MNNKRIYILKEYIIKEIKSLIKEEDSILITRRSPEEREKNHIIATQRKIQQYIKDGSKGTLDLSNTPITSLPDNLTKVGGDLELFNTPIASLPDNLKVGGSLSLINTKITSLPNNLTIKGSLYLDNTPITSLPNNLKVGDDLSLINTKITSLPNNLKVGGDLELFNTPISAKYTKEQLKQMLPGVKGEIYL
jgi:hypothetical protein